MTDDLKARGVRVRKLEWRVAQLPSRGGGKWEAGCYTIRKIEGLFLTYGWNDDFKHTSLHLDDAKAAAQADYESRILAALEISDE